MSSYNLRNYNLKIGLSCPMLQKIPEMHAVVDERMHAVIQYIYIRGANKLQEKLL